MFCREQCKSPVKGVLCIILLAVCILRISHFTKHTRSLGDSLSVQLLYDDDEYTKDDYEILDLVDAADDVSVTEVFRQRVDILRRGCSQLKRIQQLVDNKDFDGLLSLHQSIYDRQSVLSEAKGDCTSPSFNKPQTSNAKIGSIKGLNF